MVVVSCDGVITFESESNLDVPGGLLVHVSEEFGVVVVLLVPLL